MIHVDKKSISDEEAFEISINAGAKDCLNLNGYYEIITKKEDFYKIKSEIGKKINDITYSAIEWRPFNYLKLNNEQSKKIVKIFESLEEIDDVQNFFTNANLEN